MSVHLYIIVYGFECFPMQDVAKEPTLLIFSISSQNLKSASFSFSSI